MLKFTVLTEEALDTLTIGLSDELGDREYVESILSSFLELSREGIEAAVSSAKGCLMVRIYDEDRYSFVYPIEVSEAADVSSALILVSEYTRREMIPLYLTDVPRDELDRIGGIFPHIEARAYNEDEDSFVVSVLSECDMLEDVPEATYGRVRLTGLDGGDIEGYARLCRDRDNNRYWGYDYAADAPHASDNYFMEVAEVEFRRGVALSLAVRLTDGDGSLIGEAVLFDFDYLGSAMLAIRLLPEYQGQGLGKEVLAASFNIARAIGLKSLRARVKLANIPSIRMTEGGMVRCADEGDEAVFHLDL